ncbi:MAG TPA: chromate efflux transporter, partial [Opitutaceae bacterium]
PAVIALIVRACHRIGGHTLVDKPLWAIALLSALGELLGVSFYFTLPLAGAGYLFAAKRWHTGTLVVAVAFCGCAALFSPVLKGEARLLERAPIATANAVTAPARQQEAAALFGSGLRAGLLTFGGAYTAIPFLRVDAVERGGWMSEREFLDGVALAGIIPAPLIIFSTFVGYFGGGPLGALAITVGVFLPAFLFSILFYKHLEAVITHPALRHFLEGVTAGVVGLIAATTLSLAIAAIPTWKSALLFAAALAAVYRWKSKLAVPAIILSAGLAGWLAF